MFSSLSIAEVLPSPSATLCTCRCLTLHTISMNKVLTLRMCMYKNIYINLY